MFNSSSVHLQKEVDAISEIVAIENIGKLVSGDINRPILDADTILIRDGKIAEIGWKGEIDVESAKTRIDAMGQVVTPGFIDPHTHMVIGDWTPIQKAIGWMEGALLAGVTTMISQGENNIGGLPMDPVGNKALAILAAKTYKKYRPGGFLKVHGGALMLVEGLTEQDFKEMAEAGVWLIAEIGGCGLYKPKDVVPMVKWARKYGFKVSAHLGPVSIPLSAPLMADEIIEIDPDLAVHVNGGSTSVPFSEVKKLVDDADFHLEAVFNGNPRAAVEMVDYMRKKDALNRLVIGSDTPTGNGMIPVAILRMVVQIASLNRLPAAEVIAAATGNTADTFGLNVGKIEVGREADIIILDRPAGSQGRDALEAIEIGDIPGTTLIMVDGQIVALRGRDTRQTAGCVKINGVERKITTMEDYLWGPWKFAIDRLI